MLRTILCLIVFCFGSALVSQTKTDGAALLAKEIKLSDTAIKDFAPNLNSRISSLYQLQNMEIKRKSFINKE